MRAGGIFEEVADILPANNTMEAFVDLLVQEECKRMANRVMLSSVSNGLSIVGEVESNSRGASASPLQVACKLCRISEAITVPW